MSQRALDSRLNSVIAKEVFNAHRRLNPFGCSEIGAERSEKKWLPQFALPALAAHSVFEDSPSCTNYD